MSTTVDPTSGAVPILFSESYYAQVMSDFGYDRFELERFDFCLAGLDADELNLRYLCHHRAQDYLAVPQTSRIVTTGFGMSGVPHLGTVAQILRTIQMQRGGEKCQIVLGDLDAHNGKGRSLSETRELADRFGCFCVRLGFDPVLGTLRSQHDDLDCLRNQYLLAHYTEEDDFDKGEEDNHSYYATLGIVDAHMTFRRRVSLALMAADFITLGQHHDGVLVILGIDEHKYVKFARDIVSRLDGNTSLSGAFSLTSIYTRLNVGFNGHPKMSKSIPESSISATSSPDEIRRRLADDDIRLPEDSPTYQLIYQMLIYPHDETLELYRHCMESTERWKRAKVELADYLISLCEMW